MRYHIGRLKDVMKDEKGKIKSAEDILHQEQPQGREQSPGNATQAGSICKVKVGHIGRENQSGEAALKTKDEHGTMR